MNGIIHLATHPNGSSLNSLLTTTEEIASFKSNIFECLDKIIFSVNPVDLVFIALDGVPPRAKTVEQRKRRFRTAKETKDALDKKKELEQQQNGGSTSTPPSQEQVEIDKNSLFDSNSISPGTEFMAQVNQWIKEYVFSLSKKFPALTVILSDTTVPGEGEHKIMDFIRQHQHQLQENSNNNTSSSSSSSATTSHLFYGMDADLIFLGLSTQYKNFYVLRDKLDLLYCSICKGNDHVGYECKSAFAQKKLNSEKMNQIIVKLIPISTEESTIRSLFSYYGEIEKISLLKANTKKPSLSATIEFKDPSVINEIASRGGAWYINNEKVVISLLYLNEPSKKKSSNEDDGGVVSDDDEEEQKPTASTTKQVVPEDVIIHDNSIFAANLDSMVQAFDIEAYFSSMVGPVEKVSIQLSTRFPKQKFALIKFTTQESARKSLGLDGTPFFGSTISIKPARQPPPTNTDTPDPSAPPSKPSKPVETPEQKAEMEKEKQRRALEKEFKVSTFLAMADPGTTREAAYFYLGSGDWVIEKAFEVYQAYGKAPLESPKVYSSNLFDFVNLDHFRQYFIHYISFGMEDSKIQLIDFNRCINDFTLMCMMVGNDFLPHLPTLSIKDGTIELILTWYRDWIRSSTLEGEPQYILNDKKEINFKNFYHLLEVLEKWESALFPEKLEKMYRKEQIRLQQIKMKYDLNVDTKIGGNNGKIHTLTDLGSSASTPTSPISTSANTDKKVFTLKDLSSNGSKSPKKKSNTSSPLSSSPPLSSFNIPEFKYEDSTYYKLKFNIQDSQVPKQAEDMCRSYIEGLTWVIRYYTKGCPSWEWFYPYHYGPMITDFRKYIGKLALNPETRTSEFIQFKFGAPLPALLHLTTVLPRFSSGFLPEKLREVMFPPSPLSRYYNENFRIDLNGADVAWKGVVLLDFIDFELFQSVLDPIIKQLPESDQKRNQFGNDLVVINSESKYTKLEILNQIIEKRSGNHKTEHCESTVQIQPLLNLIDLNWTTRRIFSMTPYPSNSYHSLVSVVSEKAPSNNNNAALVLTESQAKFIEWKKQVLSTTNFEQSNELLDSINPKQCYYLNVNESKSTLPISRILSNEISQDKSIRIESLGDDQMIIHISFSKPSKLSGIKFISTISKESTPKSIKIYFNETIDFSNVTNLKENFSIEFNDPNELSIDSTPFTFGNTRFKPVSSEKTTL
eukprot:gene3987-4988_t